MAVHLGRIRVPVKEWHLEAYRRWKAGADMGTLAREFKVDRTTVENAIHRGKEREEKEERERARAVRGEPLITLPSRDKINEACRLFAAGEIDIGELAKRLRGRHGA